MAITPDYKHKTVLTNEVLSFLVHGKGKLYVDATFGGGGHTRALLEHDPTCRVMGIDWDKQALESNAPALKKDFGQRFTSAWGNFGHLYRILQRHNIEKVDGFLADFGTSQHQIHEKAGFSFAKDTPLDMRMSKGHHYFKASDVLNRHSQKALTKIFRDFGEEPFAHQIAKAIVEQRKTQPFETTRQLARLIERVVPTRVVVKKRIHPATRVFQALRIYVNKELENIAEFLKIATGFLPTGGRIVCISFHSLEDRIVKTFFRENSDKLKNLTKKPITASEEELDVNRSARSAKLRAAEKL